MDVTFENVFGISIKALRLCGGHPDIPKGVIWILSNLILYGGYFSYFLVLLYNIICYNFKAGDFAQTCKNAVFCSMFLSVLFQFIIILWMKDKLNNLIGYVKTDYANLYKLSSVEHKIVSKYAADSISLGKLWLAIGLGGSAIFPFKNIVLHIYYCYIGHPRLVHLYDLIFPKLIEDRKDDMPLFGILYVLMLFYMLYCGCVFCAFSPLCPNFLLHACGQVEVLTNRIKNLFTEDNSVEDILTELKGVAMELQRIYSFVEEIQDIFQWLYEILLKFTSVLMPLSTIGVIQAFEDGDMCVEFVVFIFASAIYPSIPCYYSKMLMEKSEMFRLSLYSCGWESRYDRRVRTMIILLQQRTYRVMALRTIFKLLSLEALTDVYYQAYVIFNVVNAMGQ